MNEGRKITTKIQCQQHTRTPPQLIKSIMCGNLKKKSLLEKLVCDPRNNLKK